MKIKLSLFIIGLLLCNLTAYASIIIVTDSAHTLQNIPNNARIIYLDDSIKLHQTLSDNLPNDPTQAEQLARTRLTMLGENYQQIIQHALQGVLDTYLLGVVKIPAVVKDNHYVVYGEYDVDVALQLIEQRGHDEP